jgi:hypothetical protein
MVEPLNGIFASIAGDRYEFIKQEDLLARDASWKALVGGNSVALTTLQSKMLGEAMEMCRLTRPAELKELFDGPSQR